MTKTDDERRKRLSSVQTTTSIWLPMIARLMQILNVHTYMRRKESSVIHCKGIRSRTEKASKKSKPVKLGDEYLLVDGYNIIFAWDELKELAKDNLNMARDRLRVDILCNYQGFKQCNLILIFDAYKLKEMSVPKKFTI